VPSYNDEYYARFKEGVQSSAKTIVPIILDLVQVRSVIDVGCGTGEWLSEFQKHGIEDVWGVDGDWVNERMLAIPVERFVPLDLTQRIDLGRRFDLVVSLEVAEHLPELSAETFVDSLTRLGSKVIFSAAVPNQGGKGHLNEQWQAYWAQLFDDRGYAAVDCIRNKVWTNEEVFWWYAQNILVYVAREQLESEPRLKREYERREPAPLSMVHPSSRPVPSIVLDNKLRKQRKRFQMRLARERVKHQRDLEELLQELATERSKGLWERLTDSYKMRR
jgi:SAM-dependent methyltransferase